MGSRLFLGNSWNSEDDFSVFIRTLPLISLFQERSSLQVVLCLKGMGLGESVCQTSAVYEVERKDKHDTDVDLALFIGLNLRRQLSSSQPASERASGHEEREKPCVAVNVGSKSREKLSCSPTFFLGQRIKKRDPKSISPVIHS